MQRCPWSSQAVGRDPQLSCLLAAATPCFRKPWRPRADKSSSCVPAAMEVGRDTFAAIVFGLPVNWAQRVPGSVNLSAHHDTSLQFTPMRFWTTDIRCRIPNWRFRWKPRLYKRGLQCISMEIDIYVERCYGPRDAGCSEQQRQPASPSMKVHGQYRLQRTKDRVRIASTCKRRLLLAAPMVMLELPDMRSTCPGNR
jgi:hypothetical protein